MAGAARRQAPSQIDTERRKSMKIGKNHLKNLVWKLRVLNDTRGQDLIEYALIVGFIAVAAGALIPGITTTMRSIFERISGVLVNSANQQ
jgi:Flp pilus assembly pilin Flp